MKKPRAHIVCTAVHIASPCPKKWEKLTPGQDEKQRFCSSCGETVHLCLTETESIENTRLGRCVAIPKAGFPPEIPPWMNMTIGRGRVEE